MSNNEHLSEPSKKSVKGETISELARRHLMNQNHTTSDEELENARLELSEEAPAIATENEDANISENMQGTPDENAFTTLDR